MTVRAATACFVLGLASLAASQGAAQKDLPRIVNPETLAIEMSKALVAGDRARFTALAATREEMEEMLTTAQPPGNAQERQELKTKVAEIVAERREDFDRFQAMKKGSGFKEGAAVRFELIDLDPIYEKDGMKKQPSAHQQFFCWFSPVNPRLYVYHSGSPKFLDSLRKFGPSRTNS